MIFFTKGVIETVKKLNWSPDIIHFHGWFTALFPLYLKTLYKDEPLFQDSKLVTSFYTKNFEGTLAKELQEKVGHDKISAAACEGLQTPDHDSLAALALEYSDGIILSSEQLNPALVSAAEASKKPLLHFDQTQEDNAYINFYTEQLS